MKVRIGRSLPSRGRRVTFLGVVYGDGRPIRLNFVLKLRAFS
jgi:hypothetical protein